jgi:hypothetical protein
VGGLREVVVMDSVEVALTTVMGWVTKVDPAAFVAIRLTV